MQADFCIARRAAAVKRLKFFGVDIALKSMLNFADSTKPAPCALADWLVGRFRAALEARPPILGATVVLPTAAAARAAREEFYAAVERAGYAGAADIAFTTLEKLVAERLNGRRILSGLADIAVWTRVLESAGGGGFENLFPSGVPTRDDCAAFAVRIVALQSALAENFHTINSASKKLSQTADSAKWEELAVLERRHYAAAKSLGYETRTEALLDVFSDFAETERTYIAAAILDSSGIFRRFAESLGGRLEVVVFDDHSRENCFNEYGIPNAENLKISPEISDENIFVCQSTSDEAQLAARLAKSYGADAPNVLEVACEQVSAAAVFKSEFGKLGVCAEFSGGDNLANSALGRLLARLGALAESGDFRAFADICRNPYFAAKYFAPDWSAEDFFADLDNICQSAVPADMRSAADFLRGANAAAAGIKSPENAMSVLASASEIVERLGNGGGAEIAEIVGEMAQAYFAAQARSDREARAYSLFRRVAAELSECPENTFTVRDCLGFFSDALARENYSGGGSDCAAVNLTNWIEIFWSRRPHILLADMNEGVVPLAEPEILLVNDAVRNALGLRNRDDRRARDAYMLRRLSSCHSAGGRRISIIVPKTNTVSDPLTPSPLLLAQCDLPARINLFFSDSQPRLATPHFVAPWKYRAPVRRFSGVLSVSALRLFKSSPWLFYLEHVLKARKYDAGREEMDASQFGTLFHGVLEKFAKSDVADSADASEIFEYFSQTLGRLARAMFGKSPRAQIRLQLENLRGRLFYVAQVQAQRRAQGWRIAETERKFAFDEGGFSFGGRIDRIDVRESDGAREIAVLDYKTADKIDDDFVKKAHVKSNGEWVNLQLPLYMHAAREMFAGARISCGYFLAPKDAAATRVSMWEDFDESLEVSAMEEAVKIAGEIAECRFEPHGGTDFDYCADVFGFPHSQLEKLVEFCK